MHEKRRKSNESGIYEVEDIKRDLEKIRANMDRSRRMYKKMRDTMTSQSVAEEYLFDLFKVMTRIKAASEFVSYALTMIEGAIDIENRFPWE